MSRYRWWLLLILVFVAVFGAVSWWPVSPMWTQEIKTRADYRYVHDGKSVMVWEGAINPLNWLFIDVETGRLIQRKTLEFEKNWRGYGLQLMPDGNTSSLESSTSIPRPARKSMILTDSFLSDLEGPDS